jgi:hypothetical protein
VRTKGKARIQNLLDRQETDVDPELDALKDALDGQREHVLGILEGLTDADLRRPVLPSGWTCLELVRHLTMDVERFWFGGVLAGEPDVTRQFKAGAEAHWQVPEGLSADAVFREYREAIERANAVLGAAAGRPDALEREPAVWPAEIWPNWRLPDVRHILLHVITEVACHAGHLDVVRELIDGETWLGESPNAN